ncbi:unnamed protein product [Brassicogethes aeneus]|uniref:Protein-tyrosine-phosphatase n=1 Tax=Brassicogethes aeneus TaxID=1431903 RepID=A0A9P0B609_BRAAE|nr:unnamed protein product [Brassicogethes aeneus]
MEQTLFDQTTTFNELFSNKVPETQINSSEFPLIIEENQLISNLSRLTENLILTSASAVNPVILRALNIKCIINIAPELPDPQYDADNIIYHKIPILDSGISRILPFFHEVADLINEVASSNGQTLVYCVAGVSRSASICISYLMKYHQLSLLEAYNYVKIKRPRIKPNCGFFKQLIEYEKQLYCCNTVVMVFNEFVKMSIPNVYDSEYRFINNLTKKRIIPRNKR